jgi:hypothetical protein
MTAGGKVRGRVGTAQLWTAIKDSRSKSLSTSASALKELLTMALGPDNNIAVAASAALLRDHNIEAGPAAPRRRESSVSTGEVVQLPLRIGSAIKQASMAVAWAVAAGFALMWGEDIAWDLIAAAIL